MTGKASSYRHKDALLAGVCAEFAQRLGWNVWAIRALAIAGLFIHALGTGALYIVMALVMPLIRNHEVEGPDLASPELDERQHRIAELERRFKDLENGPR